MQGDHARKLAEAGRLLQRICAEYDMARFRAQQHEIDAVDFAYATMCDGRQPIDVRLRCMDTILDRARGKVGTRGSDLPVEAISTVGGGGGGGDEAIGIRLDAVRAGLDRFRELSRWVGVVPESEWPPFVKEMLDEQEADLSAGQAGTRE